MSWYTWGGMVVVGGGSLAGLSTGNTTMHLVFLVEHSTPCFSLPTFAVSPPAPLQTGRELETAFPGV